MLRRTWLASATTALAGLCVGKTATATPTQCERDLLQVMRKLQADCISFHDPLNVQVGRIEKVGDRLVFDGDIRQSIALAVRTCQFPTVVIDPLLLDDFLRSIA